MDVHYLLEIIKERNLCEYQTEFIPFAFPILCGKYVIIDLLYQHIHPLKNIPFPKLFHPHANLGELSFI